MSPFALGALRLWPIALVGGAYGVACGDVLGIPEYGTRAVVGCDASSDDPNPCPPTAGGRPRTCFGAAQLGGRDFCADACDPDDDQEDPEGFACLRSGALLRICDPADALTCPEGLNCFRTDLTMLPDFYPVQYGGLCISAPVCNDHDECQDQGTRLACGGAILRETYPTIQRALYTDHLQCVQACGASEPPCPRGETCLDALLLANLPQICVPNCESGRPCPPNFYCLANSGPAYPEICAPGLPGSRCMGPEDCLLGYCAETRLGFNLCTVGPCQSDSDCAALDALFTRFLCVEQICVNKAPYSGVVCKNDGECPEGDRCSGYNPYDPSTPRQPLNGECRRPCDESGRCQPRGSVPYVCLPNCECYPGDLGLDCLDSDECVGDLFCECIENCEPGAENPRKICTQTCLADADCMGISFNLDETVCVAGLCQMAEQPAFRPHSSECAFPSMR